MNLNKNFNTLYNNFYGGLTKLGKIMSKNLESENVGDFNLYPYDKKLLFNVKYIIYLQIIAKDLYRRGDFNTADSFIKESQLEFDQNFRFIFNDLNVVTKDLKDKNIDTLIDWCVKYKSLLDNMKSSLHFESLKLKVSIYIVKCSLYYFFRLNHHMNVWNIARSFSKILLTTRNILSKFRRL